MIVRNNWNKRTLTRGDIQGFRLGGRTRSGVPGSQVQVLLRDETPPLDVTTAALPLPRAARLHERLQQLQAWHGS